VACNENAIPNIVYKNNWNKLERVSAYCVQSCTPHLKIYVNYRKTFNKIIV